MAANATNFPPFYIRTADGKFVAGMIDGVPTWLSTEECE